MRLTHFSALVTAFAASLLTGCAGPGLQQGYYDQASSGYSSQYAQPQQRVVHSTPRYVYGYEPSGYVQPYQAYRQQQPQRYYDDNRYSDRQRMSNNGTMGGALGAVVGAAAGNQVGRGTGRTAATAVGGVVGYAAGEYANDPCATGVTPEGVAGALVGGLLLKDVGRGRGRDAAAAAGAVAGYAVGNNLSNRRPRGC